VLVWARNREIGAMRCINELVLCLVRPVEILLELCRTRLVAWYSATAAMVNGGSIEREKNVLVMMVWYRGMEDRPVQWAAGWRTNQQAPAL
jgi:hypothetical protein